MAIKIVQLSRDPFARLTTVRQRVDSRDWYRCGWCAQRAPKRLWRYGEEGDSGRIYWDYPVFCCIGCRRAYNG